MPHFSPKAAYHPEPTPGGDQELTAPLVGVVDTITEAESTVQLLTSAGVDETDIAIIDRSILLKPPNAQTSPSTGQPGDITAQLRQAGLQSKRADIFAADVTAGRVLVVVDPPPDKLAVAWNIVNHAYDSDSAR